MNAEACARSDVGKSRSANEDFFAIRPESDLFLVADGMGGHGNGEVASRLAALSVCDTIEDLAQSGKSGQAGGPASREGLRLALERANSAVFKAVEKDESLAGMGATMVAMRLEEDKAVIAHVGDSRAYRWRGGRLEQLTTDHTWVGQQVSAGELSDEEARHHPFRNVVTRALGGEAKLAVDVATHDVEPEDLFLLCTDGLTAVLDDEAIVDRLHEEDDLDTLCEKLIDAANEGGGPDNVTVVVVSCAADASD